MKFYEKRKKHIILTIIFVLFSINSLTAMGFLESSEEKQKKDIYNLKQEIVPIKFTIQKNKRKDSFTINFKFYDLNKNEITSEESLEIAGKELFLECVVVNVNRYTKAVFPYRIYSELIPPKDGILILKKYEKDKTPAIFNGIKTRQMEYLKEIYEDIKAKNFYKDWFYSVVHTMAPKKKKSYKLACRIKGGIEIFEDDDE